MGNKTRKQHYVWRFYLKPWCYKDEEIHCSRLGKIFTPNLMGIANQRDFYRLTELSDYDQEYIELLAIKKSPIDMQPIHRDWIKLYRYPFSIINNLIKSGKSDPELFDKIINDSEEKLHGHIESNSIKYLEMLRKKDMKFYETEEGNIDFNFFLCEQYMRTKKRKQFAKEFDKKDNLIDFEKLWPVLKHIFATNMAFNFHSRASEFKMILLENNTNTTFITGDQPVINTFATKEKQGKPVDDVELYYPITPYLGIIITKSSKYQNYIVAIDEDQVKILNNLIYVNSLEQIYAINEQSLRNII